MDEPRKLTEEQADFLATQDVALPAVWDPNWKQRISSLTVARVAESTDPGSVS